MYSNPLSLKRLILDLIDQIIPDIYITSESLTNPVVKNLIIITKILTTIKTSDDNKLSLSWLIGNLKKTINVEIIKAPKSTTVVRIYFVYYILPRKKFLYTV